MCGIAGIIDLNCDILKRNDTVLKMSNALIHRGPDDVGWHSDDLCTLTMRRLAIIDLHFGKQPIFNEDKSILVFLNGEIYNYIDLRQELKAKGHIFSTLSDTEVIVHLYEDYGISMVSKLKGMFTFCIYDTLNKIWHIGRDRFGEKPLFYYHTNEYLCFSSEIASLLENLNVPRDLNKTALVDYLSNSLVPEPNTLLQNVFSLEPGSYLSFDGEKPTIYKYFSPSYKTDLGIKDTEDCIEILKPIISSAVKSQMISDVPLGAFLSGGIDSSTIVANMQMNSSVPIKTFTVKFENSDYDESKIAKEVSDFLGTEHNEIVIKNNDFNEEMFWKIIKHVGLPFCDSSAIPTFFITEEIRKHVKVALSGDGGDEIFAGYPIYNWWQKIDKFMLLPLPIRKISKNLLESTSLKSTSYGKTLLRVLLASMGTSNEIGARISILFSDKELIFLTNGQESNFSNFSNFPKESTSWSVLQKALFYRIKHDLALDMLVKVDRMSMANSLEVRAPFLDIDLFEAVSKIPPNLLIQNGSNKFLLRKIMEQKLPKSVFEHPKTGFSIPLHSYMNNDFERLCHENILNNKKMLSLFSYDALKYFVDRGFNQKRNNHISVYRSSHQLWALLQLGGWLNYFNINING